MQQPYKCTAYKDCVTSLFKRGTQMLTEVYITEDFNMKEILKFLITYIILDNKKIFASFYLFIFLKYVWVDTETYIDKHIHVYK